jgi:hypothetical protein
LTVAAQKKLREFAKQHLDFLKPEQVQVSFLGTGCLKLMCGLHRRKNKKRL